MSWRIRDARAFDDALSGRAPRERDIDALVATVERICALAADLAPTAVFLSSLRARLVIDAATVLGPGTSFVAVPQRHPRPHLAAPTARHLTWVLAALILTLGLAGITGTSASALPGDTLYPVKRGIEDVQLSLKPGAPARGTFLLELASRRLAETRDLADRTTAPSELTADTLDEYRQRADEGSRWLVRSFQAGGSTPDIVALNRFAAGASTGLGQLNGRLDGRAASSLDEARDQLAALVGVAARLCPDCGGIEPALAAALTQP